MAITTNNEYFLAVLSRFNVTQTDIDVMLLEAGITGSASVDEKKKKNAIYKGFTLMLPLANVSEGGYSVSWNMEAVKLYYNQLCKELGESNVLQQEIRNNTNIW